MARATLHASPRPRRGEELAVGLMSGTSCDGIDAALVAIAPRPDGLARVRTIATAFTPYPADARAHLLRFPKVDLFDLAIVDRELGLRFAAATRALLSTAGVPAKRVSFVASHGHTAIHLPRAHGGATVQIGQPAELAERLGIRVVADFRPRDVAAGGEGAPLVPFADRILLARPGKVVACQNVGGIANVTAVGPGRDDVLAFDTGPGNMPIDAAVAHATKGRRRFDEGGRIAASGTVDVALLRTLHASHPYFRRLPPKSTGREEFGSPFTDALLAGARTARSRRDLVATLTALTAHAIADAYRRFLPRVDECVVSGGGVHNATLLRFLRDALGGTPVVSSAERGVDPDFKEAIAFALLGWAHLRGRANTVPAATGAARAVVAGAVWPGASPPARGR